MTITAAKKTTFLLPLHLFPGADAHGFTDNPLCVSCFQCPVFLFCLELFRPLGVRLSSHTCLLPTVQLFSSGPLYPELQKKINISAPTGYKPLKLFLITFPDERFGGEAREEEFVFPFQLISISFKSE